MLGERGLDYDTDAEAHLVGGLLQGDETARKVLPDVLATTGLSARIFYKSAHGAIWTSIVRLFEQGSPVGLDTVLRDLTERKESQRVGGIEALYELRESVPTAANCVWWAEEVLKAYRRRALKDAGGTILNLATNPDRTFEDAYESSVRELTTIASTGHRRTYQDVEDGMRELSADFEAKAAGKGRASGFSTGLPTLDRTLGGLRRGSLIVVAARTGMGKSMFALNLVSHAALREGIPSQLFSLEMSHSEVFRRLASRAGRVNNHSLQTLDLNADDWGRVAASLSALEDMRLRVDTCSDLLLIRAAIERYKAEMPDLGLIVVDYVQLVSGGAKNDNRSFELGGHSKALKRWAMEYEVCVVEVAQLNRNPTARADKRPQLSDISSSDEISHDADAVLLLHDEDYYSPEKAAVNPHALEVIIAKNRNGALTTATFDLYPQFCLICEHGDFV